MRYLGEGVYQLYLLVVRGSPMQGDDGLQVRLELQLRLLVVLSVADGALRLAHVGERSMFSFL